MVHTISGGNIALRSDCVAYIVPAIFPVGTIVDYFSDLLGNLYVDAIVIGTECPDLRGGLFANFCVEKLVSGL